MKFRARLFRYPGPGGWTFAKIPARHAPPVTHGWGRTPVTATIDGQRWDTSVWRDTTHGTLLAVPARLRGDKGDGDLVEITLAERAPSSPSAPTPRPQKGSARPRRRPRRG